MNSTKRDLVWWGALLVTMSLAGGWGYFRLDQKRTAQRVTAARTDETLARLRAKNERLRFEIEKSEQESKASRGSVAAMDSSQVVTAPEAVRALVDWQAKRLVTISPENIESERIARIMRRSSLLNELAEGRVPEAITLAGDDEEARRRLLNVPPKIGIFGLTLEGRLPDTFAEVFGLDQARFAALQQVIVATKERIDRVTLEGTRVRQEADGAVVMDVNVGAQALALRERLRSALETTLGSELFEAYEVIGRGGFEKLWRDFRGLDYQAKVWSKPDKGYRVEIQYFGADGKPAGWMGKGFYDEALLAEHLGVLARLLPPDF